ncbi:MAG: hypothetical protein RL274_2305 [Pseudomonadota bacterium]|jgi:hypothetical protein
MQHTQYNVVQLYARAALVAAVILAANPASGATANPTGPRGATIEKAGPITHAGKPDPLLDGGDTSACMAGADLAAGTDATGSAVIPADVGAPRVMLPDEIMVPVGGAGRPQLGGRGRNPVTGAGGGIYAGFDGRRMAPLLNPKPCPR